MTGALYGDWGQLGAQAVGALVICTVMLGIVFAFFKLQDKLTKGGIRCRQVDELEGLDLPEMGVPADPEFMPDGVVVEADSGKDPSGRREYVGAAAPAGAPPGAPDGDGTTRPAGPGPVLE